MKKIWAFISVILILAIPAMAQQNIGSQSVLRPRIKVLGVLGNGIAVSSNDPMDFEVVKAGIATVRIRVLDEFRNIRVGIMYIGDERYKIKNIVMGNGSISGDLYKNDSQVGSFSIDSYLKGNTEIWAGSLKINEDSYNLYIIQAHRKPKTIEVVENIVDYCKNNPLKCKATIKAVGKQLCDNPSISSCRDKIKNYCEAHTDDKRCKALYLAYCKYHLKDSRCREKIIEYCKNNPKAAICNYMVTVYPRVTKIRQKIFKKAPRWFRNAKERVEAHPELLIRSTTANASEYYG